jgi:hypothetical protein
MARRSKKSSYTQKLAGMATMGMPAPVQKVATSRLGSRLLLIVIPILLATGVITVSFSGGMPTFTFHKDRAIVVGREAEARAIKAAERIEQYRDTSYR